MKFRIKEARERVGLSQKELANKLNIKPTTFNGYETGAHDPKSGVLVEIAKACDTTVDYLLGLTNNPSIENKKTPPLTLNEDAKIAYDKLMSLIDNLTDKDWDKVMDYITLLISARSNHKDE